MKSAKETIPPIDDRSASAVATLSLEETQQLLHTLKVHQAVLELQNEELCKTVAELDSTKASYADFYNMAPVGFVTLSNDDLIEQANLTAGNLLGVSQSALLNQPISAFIHPDDQENYERHRLLLVATSQSQICELRMQRKDGTPFWGRMESLAVPLGNATMLRIVLSDISESRRIDEIKANSAFQRAILDSISASIAVIDPEGIIIATNEGWWRSALENSPVPGKTAAGTDIGSNYLSACLSNDGAGVCDGIISVLEGRAARFSIEYPCHTPQQERWFKMSVTPLGKNAKFGAVIAHADITENIKASIKLRESEAQLQEIINLMPIELFIKDASSNLILMNQACEEQWGCSFSKLRGTNGSQLFPPEQMEFFLAKDKQIFDNRELLDFEEVVWSSKANSNRLKRTFKKPTFTADGKPQYLICLSLDITELRQIEQRLRESESRYYSVVSTLHEGVVLQDHNGTIKMWNGAAERILGLSGDQLGGKTSLDPNWRAIHEDGSGFMGENHPSMVALRTGKPQSNVVMGVHKPTGELSWVSINAVPIFAANESLPESVVVSFSDITQQKTTHEELLANQELLQDALSRLRSLAADNQEAIEHEKKHLARELHDELGQLLAALRMDIGLVKMEYAQRLPEIVPKAEKMLDTLDRALFSTRHVVSNLRPTILDMGLQAALEWLRDDFSQMFGIACYVECKAIVPTLSEMQLIAIFRVVQESLTNIAKHAQANRVNVNVTITQDNLQVLVQDNGVGFEFDGRHHRNLAQGNRRSFGLQGMNERINAFKGNVEVKTALGKGCRVILNMPIEENIND
ncbi:MAG: PAS domain S-box protein [Gallionellaceae bacterium]